MTLAIALRGSNGLVLASDSRMSGSRSKDDSTKFLQVNRDIGVMTFGLAVPGNAGIRKLRDNVNSKQLAHFSQIVVEAREVFVNEYTEFTDSLTKQGVTIDPRLHTLGFILAGFDSHETNQFKIYLYESPEFTPVERADVCAAQWHISKIMLDYLQYPQMTVEQLKELSVMMMLETSSFNEAVGGPIQIATVTYDKGFRQLHQDEVNKIVACVQPKIIKFRSAVMKEFNYLISSI
jgi:20S proteasome alpha/beta subunit